VGPFEFIILFFSFIYTLALTHIFFAATRMIRHRRSLVFSWPHALWMGVALMLLLVNWVELWDFHQMETMPLSVMATGFLMVSTQYFVSALVAPDFEDGESYDLRAFHAREGRTYIGAVGVLFLLSLAVNFAAGAAAGIANWANQNLPLLAVAPFVAAPLFLKNRFVQVICPLAIIAFGGAILAMYYPVLK
jgi:hypothetical protein